MIASMLFALVLQSAHANPGAIVPQPHRSFIGIRSQEATVRFPAEVWVETSASRSKPFSQEIEDAIRAQVKHLMGPLKYSFKAGIRGDSSFKEISVDRAPLSKTARKKVFRVSYVYRGTFTVSDEIGATLPLVLALEPSKIYSQANKECTNETASGEGVFWYYWSPARPGCALEEGKHFKRVEAALERKNSTTGTYPEYDRLVDANGTIAVTVVFGIDDPKVFESRNPFDRGEQWSSNDYITFVTDLGRLGFTQVPAEQSDPSYHSEKFEKETPKGRIVVTTFYGESGIREKNAKHFHRAWKLALEKSAIAVYNGHAGYGRNLSLSQIGAKLGKKLRPAKDRYQLLALNGCNTYGYYARQYFAAKASSADKAGTKNLDLLVTGIESHFNTGHVVAAALLGAVDRWAQGLGSMSYPEILAGLTRFEYLYAIDGDQDNPTAPTP